MDEESRRQAGHETIGNSRSVVRETVGQFYEFGPFRLDPAEHKLLRGNEIVPLPPKAFETLVVLVRNSGHLLEKDELLKMLWPDTFVEEGSLSNSIFLLRKALGEDPAFIETVPRRGYRFVGAVRQFPVATAVQERPPERGLQLADGAQKATRWRLRAVGAGIVALCALLAVGFYWFRSPLPLPKVLGYTRLTTDRQIKSGNLWDSMVTDGPRVFFSEPNSAVAQVSSAGGDVVKVSTPFAVFLIFDISPDKTELLGSAKGFPPDQPFWALSIASGLAHRLGNLEGHAAAWSPDGQKIVYATNNDFPGGSDLYIASKDGSEARRLARMENEWAQFIRWSPDGKLLRIIFWHESSSTLWEMSSDGTNLHSMNLFPGEGLSILDENWTSDGRYFYLR